MRNLKLGNFFWARKSQITIFLVLGVALIVGVGLFFLFNDSFETLSSDADPITVFVSGCLEATTQEGIEYLGKTGGYFVPYERSTVEGIAFYYDGTMVAPTREKVANELAQYIDNFLPFCIVDFSSFEDFVVSDGRPKSFVEISDEAVSVRLDYLVRATKGDTTVALRTFDSRIFSRMGVMHTTAVGITQDSAQRSGDVCVSCAYEAFSQADLFGHLYDYDNSTWLFILRDDTIEKDPYYFYFALKKNGVFNEQ